LNSLEQSIRLRQLGCRDDRHALSAEIGLQFVATARKGSAIEGISGSEQVMLYILASLSERRDWQSDASVIAAGWQSSNGHDRGQLQQAPPA
jgi:hypothetical protein